MGTRRTMGHDVQERHVGHHLTDPNAHEARPGAGTSHPPASMLPIIRRLAAVRPVTESVWR